MMRHLALGIVILSLPVAADAQFKQRSLPDDHRPSGSWSPQNPPVDRPAGPTIGQEVMDVRERIGQGRASGTLTRQEARGLRREAGSVGLLADLYGTNGLSDSERRELDGRMQVVRDNVVIARTRGLERKDGRGR